METNSTHVASTGAVLEVGGGINGIEFHKKLPPKLRHIPGGWAYLEFVWLKFGPPGPITFQKYNRKSFFLNFTKWRYHLVMKTIVGGSQ